MAGQILYVCLTLQGRLIVSCQAPEGDPFHQDPEAMAKFARAAVAGGAAGIRANGPRDIRAIRQAVSVPIIGIYKKLDSEGRILITPSAEEARQVLEAGADIVALSCTRRAQSFGALDTIREIKSELGVPVLADIATVEEAKAAAKAGADFVLSTLRGYTADTEHLKRFEPAFIAELVRKVEAPAIAEGRIDTPELAREALAAGAFAVVVGAAITRPQEITRRFVVALERARALSEDGGYYLGIDLGATNTKFGLVGAGGAVDLPSSAPTPQGGGRDVLLGHLKKVARHGLEMARERGLCPAACGVATAGWVDPQTGRVVYATENLPGWTGAPIAEELESDLNLPVAVENDANAAAVAERHFGAARHTEDFVCVTLGTGVGGGCYVGGRLSHGAHFFGNALGHIVVEPGGLPCTCGQQGCLEVYANAAALVRYAGKPELDSAEKVIRQAGQGCRESRRALRVYAGYLARGCAAIVHLFDPELLVFSGGITQDNPFLVADVEEELARQVTVWAERRLRLVVSPLGYHAGVLGAAAVAREKLASA